MPTSTIRPSGDVNVTGFTFSGGVTATPLLNDNSDASYIEDNTASPGRI